MSEPVYEVVWPLGASMYNPQATAREVTDLSGKTVCQLWDWVFRGNEIFPAVAEILSKRYPGIKFVHYDVFGNTHSPKEREIVAHLPEMLRDQGCDAVISGVGA
ncbi:MAG: hypothetical protein HYX92_21575 [Chloroflexi bacterium]|nr:hypothetical protein [Chloroflexota bacterium]